MLSKYEEFKIASIVLGKSMKQLADAESVKIREACLDSRSHPDISDRIQSSIQEASQKWDRFYYADYDSSDCSANKVATPTR